MKAQIILLGTLALFMFGACNNTNVPEDPATKNQPADPSSWSPAGHIYIYETTWEGSHASDFYWVWVLNFFSKDSVLWYQTDLRDLKYNGSPAYARTTYKTDYPKLMLHIDSGRNVTFIDTTTIDASWWDIVYAILR